MPSPSRSHTDTQADLIRRAILGYEYDADSDPLPLNRRTCALLALYALLADLQRLEQALTKISDRCLAYDGIPDRDKLVGVKQEADRALAALRKEPQ